MSAAAIIKGNYVKDVATLNYRIQFKRFNRVSEPAQVMRDAVLHGGRGNLVAAVWEG